MACDDALNEGPLGFPVVDVQVSLVDGSYHSVEFVRHGLPRRRRGIAMAEALPKARPVLLEPIHLGRDRHSVSDAMSRASAIVSGRRGQILGYDGRPGWEGWDVLKALMPEAEIGDLIIELRSATAGVGTYRASLDHLAELRGKPAEAVMRKCRGRGMFRRARELGWMAAVRFLAPFLCHPGRSAAQTRDLHALHASLGSRLSASLRPG